MTGNNEKIDQLILKLETLRVKQSSISQEINELRGEIVEIKNTQANAQFDKSKEIKRGARVETNLSIDKKEPLSVDQTQQVKTYKDQPSFSSPKPNIIPNIKSDIEKFVGENLINKIGIVITVIGVAIGAKYSIEHQLITPLTRIVLGYLMGGGLLGVGIKLKKNYENYSAVLVSGAIAILYFITYAAYSFYGLIPQAFAFSLMVVFTSFTVIAAINYNNQVIAHIGLVGAYAVPFLLSEGSGKVGILFSYMLIINIGILFIAFKKYWKSLYYSSFLFTWLIFFSWFATKYQATEHFGLALVFLCMFFAIFYSIFISYKLFQKEKFDTPDIILLLANAFLFYGIGYAILRTDQTGETLLGLFTLFNASIHFAVSAVIYKRKLADRNLFFLIAGLVLVFITIAIPVQLDGNWVTLIWALEAALLFWIGRTKNVSVYEMLSYPLMFLAFISIIQDWSVVYNNYSPTYPETRLTPLLNINFLSSVLFIGPFGFINYLNNSKDYISSLHLEKTLKSLITFSVPAILLIAIYCSFRLEISTYWDQLYIDSAIEIKKNGQEYPDSYWNYDLKKFRSLWIINYSFFFFSLLSYINITKLKDRNLGLINVLLNTVAIVIFLAHGLYILSELREGYLNQTLSEYYNKGIYSITIRYISLAFVGLTLTFIYKYIHQEFIKPLSFNVTIAFDMLLYITLLWIASSELLALMDMLKVLQSDKLGLSILWGVYALLLIILGIWKNKKHLRLGAIALFSITLIKLFFYDISQLETIAKTIVFVSLGILLLIISFLYNKFKHLIFEANES
jgi:uncharacterized membrane protein